jgi:D-arabinonate dehydratase
VQLGCASPQVSILEKFEGTDVKNFDLILDNPMSIEPTGHLRVPERPGHAIEFNQDAVERWTTHSFELRAAASAVIV